MLVANSNHQHPLSLRSDSCAVAKHMADNPDDSRLIGDYRNPVAGFTRNLEIDEDVLELASSRHPKRLNPVAGPPVADDEGLGERIQGGGCGLSRGVNG